MTRIIVITSGKGGVGKTTTTSNIGMALARLNHKTLLIDADIGLRNLDLLLGLENRIIYTGNDVLKGTCRLEQALIQDKREPNLTFFPIASSQSKLPVTKDQLQELIEILQDKFDFILIDSPAGIDDGFQTSVHSAHEAIVASSVKTIECVLVEIMMKLPNTTREEALGILRKEREVAKNGLKNYGYHIIKPENN